MVAIVVVFAVCCTVEPHLNGHHFLQTSVPEMKADHYGEEPSILLLKDLAVQRKVHCTILFVFVFRLWRPGFRGGRPKEGSLYCCYRPQQSCGQGNVFTGVCHSFCSQGGSLETPPQAGRTPPPRKQTPAYGLRAAGTHPTGMHSCLCCFYVVAPHVSMVRLSKRNRIKRILW